MGSRKRSKDIWTCPHKCPNDKVACEHLEALVNRDVGQGLHRNLKYVSDTSILPQAQFDYGSRSTTEEEERLFTKLLKDAGCIPEEIAFMVDKYVNNKSVREIAKDHGFTSKSTAGYFYRKIKAKLKRTLKKAGH